MKNPIMYKNFSAQKPSLDSLAISPLNNMHITRKRYIAAKTKLILYTADTPKHNWPPPLSFYKLFKIPKGNQSNSYNPQRYFESNKDKKL